MKTCLVAYAEPGRQWTWRVTLDEAATVSDVLAQARQQAGAIAVPWDADVGIFGELCGRDAVPRDGDRIELYRPLRSDPKASRRARVAAGRAERDRAPSPPRSSRRP